MSIGIIDYDYEVFDKEDKLKSCKELTNILKTHLNKPPNNKHMMVSVQCIDGSPNFPNCKKYNFNCSEFHALVKKYNHDPNNKISYSKDLENVSVMDKTHIHLKYNNTDINRLILC